MDADAVAASAAGDVETSNGIPELERGSAAGRNLVVAIGIDRYAAWTHLGNAVSDARGTAAAFRSLGFTEIAALTDAEATRDAMHRLVVDGLGGLRVEDNLVIFFAGHGALRTRQLAGETIRDGYLIPFDAEDRRGQAATWIALDTWLHDIARLPPRHILVILDACHSAIELDAMTRNIRPWFGEPDLSLSRRQSRKVIVSALGEQEALDGGPRPGHSLFTGHLIDLLTGSAARAGRRVISGTDLGAQIGLRVTEQPQAKQTPRCVPFHLDAGGDFLIPLAGAAAAGSAPISVVERDAAAGAKTDDDAGDQDALRRRLAAALGAAFRTRASIARVIALHAPTISPSDLPAGCAVTTWMYILVELTNRGGLSTIAALAEAARQRSRWARRVDWSAFGALQQAPPVPAVLSWSELAIDLQRDLSDLRRNPAHSGRIEIARIASSEVVLEGTVRQRWIGARPPEPKLEVTSRQWFGSTKPLLHKAIQAPTTEPAAARWLVQIQVPSARWRTRSVTVRCAGTRAMDRHHVVPWRSAACAALLLIASLVAVEISLYGIHPWLLAIPLVAIGMGLGVVPSIGLRVLSMLTGRRSLRRLLFAWELTLPLTLLIALVMFGVVPRSAAVITNHTDEDVQIGGGRVIPANARLRVALRWHVDGWHPERPLCLCGEPNCRHCPAPTHSSVLRLAIDCEYRDCQHLTEVVGPRDAISIIVPRGAALTGSLQLSRRALGPHMAVASGNAEPAYVYVDRSKLRSDAVPPLRVLPGLAPYTIAFSTREGATPEPTTRDGVEIEGTLDCNTASPRVIRIEIDGPPALADRFEARSTLAPADPIAPIAPIEIAIGGARSQWTGRLGQARACADETWISEPLSIRLPIADGTLECTGGWIDGLSDHAVRLETVQSAGWIAGSTCQPSEIEPRNERRCKPGTVRLRCTAAP